MRRFVNVLIMATLAASVLPGCFDECRTDADCDDGIFCNGPERCGTIIALPCREGIHGCVCSAFSRDPCSNPEPVCDEATDSCGVCTADSECDDGIACSDDACDGASGECLNERNDANCGDDEVCDIRAEQRCVVGPCVDSNDCAEPTPVCVHHVDFNTCSAGDPGPVP